MGVPQPVFQRRHMPPKGSGDHPLPLALPRRRLVRRLLILMSCMVTIVMAGMVTIVLGTAVTGVVMVAMAVLAFMPAFGGPVMLVLKLDFGPLAAVLDV